MTFEAIYRGDWNERDDVFRDFALQDRFTIDIIFAYYSYEDYSGTAHVIGFDNEKNTYFEVHGSHCSCYGLEDQWDEERCTLEELKAMLNGRSDKSHNNNILFKLDEYAASK